jgi:hypothetical protein
MRAPPCRIEAGLAAALKVERGLKSVPSRWQRLNGESIFKVPLSVTGVKP